MTEEIGRLNVTVKKMITRKKDAIAVREGEEKTVVSIRLRSFS